MAVLSIAWSSPGSVAPKEDKVVTPKEGEEAGKDEAVAAAVKRADKPMFVYITDPSAADTEAFDKVEKIILTEDKIVMGCKAFACYRLSPDAAAKDRLLSAHGKDVPRILLISTDYKDVTVLEGTKLSISDLWKAMQQEFKAVYKGDLEKYSKAMTKVLQEFDKVGAAMKVQEEKEQRAEKPTAADKAEWAKTRDELKERQTKAEKERDALLKFEKKPLKAVA